MSGNSFGNSFVVTTFGESHGVALGCIIDGCPPGIEISESYLQDELDRRKPGSSKYTTQRKEEDKDINEKKEKNKGVFTNFINYLCLIL